MPVTLLDWDIEETRRQAAEREWKRGLRGLLRWLLRRKAPLPLPLWTQIVECMSSESELLSKLPFEGLKGGIR